MTKRTYIIALDSSDPTIDIEGLKTSIRENPEFSAWWNHIPCIFLVTSDKDAEEIYASIGKFTRNASFVVMEVDPKNSQGWLPRKAWDWIKNRRGKAAIAAKTSVSQG